jgi:hypothetical protein
MSPLRLYRLWSDAMRREGMWAPRHVFALLIEAWRSRPPRLAPRLAPAHASLRPVPDLQPEDPAMRTCGPGAGSRLRVQLPGEVSLSWGDVLGS